MNTKKRIPRKTCFNPAPGIGFIIVFLIVSALPVAAIPLGNKASGPGSAACLSCHTKPGMLFTFSNKEKLSLTIDKNIFNDSVHKDIACNECHVNIGKFPHAKQTLKSAREYSLKAYLVCQKCHELQNTKMLDSVHMRAIEKGNTNAAICTDCHNPHTQTPITDKNGALLPSARLHIPETCNHCHSAIYNTYKQSIHGAALTMEGNTDVPTCIDCHGVHNIGDPTTIAFRLSSPLICSKCHTNRKIMDKYGISTQVLNTYVSDFHGTSVTLFKQSSPDDNSNKPVCFDCHGIHNIKNVNDPVHGLHMKENLLAACRRCHPDANAEFPDSWMSHYIPSPTHYPIVYFVNLFYLILIPLVIGGMIIFILSDILRRVIGKRKGEKA